jgi:hypothetical protein
MAKPSSSKTIQSLSYNRNDFTALEDLLIVSFCVSFAFEIAFAAPKEQVATTNIMWMLNRHNQKFIWNHFFVFDGSWLACATKRDGRCYRTLKARKVLKRFCMFNTFFRTKLLPICMFHELSQSVFLQVLLAEFPHAQLKSM